MAELISENCESCAPDAPRLTDAEIRDLLGQVPDWEVIELDGVPRLRRRYRFRNFEEALKFTNLVGDLAEAEDHHPALLTEWGSVEVSWWSHKIKGLHRNDFIMAAKTDQLSRRDLRNLSTD